MIYSAQVHRTLGSDHLIFMGGGGRFFAKNNQVSDKDKQNRQDDQANKKNIQDGVKKRPARKCQKTNGHKLTYNDI